LKKAPKPLDEELRLEDLYKYDLLDSHSEESFDELTELARDLTNSSIALISIIDKDRQWFKSKQGLDAPETPRDISYCGHAIMDDELFIIENSALDERFCDNPLFTGPPHVTFYAGAPLIMSSGFRIGTLCVIDSKPKVLDEFQKKALRSLAKSVVRLIELNFNNQKLLKMQRQSEDIQTLAKTGGWELDLRTNKTFWTEEVYKIHGVDHRLPFDKNDAIKFYAEHEIPRLEKIIQNAIIRKEKFDNVFEFYDANNKKKWVRSIGEPILDKNKNVIKLIGIFKDVTIEKENEIAAKNINDQLINAKDKAIAYSNAKSNFLANMSHEIRTPMNGVIGMISLLKETSLNSSQIEMIDIIQGCGDHLLSIINDILDFSKVESGKIEIENISFDLNQTLNEIIYLLKNLTTVKNINFETKFDNDLPAFIIGDVGKVKQIIMNLISNASKFTEKGSISLDVSAITNDGKKVELQFKIKDTGIGISEENQLKLFNAFTQADSSTTRKFGGTGLGLSICKKLVSAMNGTIQLNSQINIGTEVIVNLPFEISSKLEVGKSIEKAPTIKTDMKFSENFPHKILVAEDNKVNQKLIHMMLKKLGYQIEFANNGKEAVDMSVLNDYSLIFMDMQMPELDGIEATKIILERLDKKAPKIIAITANAMIEDKAKCIQAGMIEFLTKPIKLDDLRKIISKIG